MAYSDLFLTQRITQTAPPESGTALTISNSYSFSLGGRFVSYPTEVQAECERIKAQMESPEVRQAILDGLITCEQARDSIIGALESLVLAAISPETYAFPMLGDFSYNLPIRHLPQPPYVDGNWYTPFFEFSNSGGILDDGNYFYANVGLKTGTISTEWVRGPVERRYGLGQFDRMNLSYAAAGERGREGDSDVLASLSFAGWSASFTILTGYLPALVDQLMPSVCGINPPDPVAIGGGMSFNPITPEERENDPFLISVSNPPTETVLLFANHTYELNPIGMRGK